jgi:hypothetical protein
VAPEEPSQSLFSKEGFMECVSTEVPMGQLLSFSKAEMMAFVERRNFSMFLAILGFPPSTLTCSNKDPLKSPITPLWECPNRLFLLIPTTPSSAPQKHEIVLALKKRNCGGAKNGPEHRVPEASSILKTWVMEKPPDSPVPPALAPGTWQGFFDAHFVPERQRQN